MERKHGDTGGDARAAAAERMRRAVGSVQTGGSREELQAASRALVHELRRGNAPPEEVLLQIKDFLAEAGLRPTYATDGSTATPASTIYRDVIAWTIKAYYDGG